MQSETRAVRRPRDPARGDVTNVSRPADPRQPPEPGLRRAAARGAGVAAMSFIAAQLFMFIAYVVLARLATPSVFGNFAAGSILMGVGGLFSESGMSAALVQRRDDLEEAASTAFASTLVGGVFLTLGALALSPLVGLLFHSRKIGEISAALSGYLILNGLTVVPGTVLQKRLALRRWIVDPIAALAFGIVSAAGLALGWEEWGLVAGFYASGVTLAVGYWIAARWLPKRHQISFAMWRELARYARHILASELLREAMRVTNTAAIGRTLGPASLGQFRFSWRLVTQAVAPAMTANAYTLQPAFVRLAHDHARRREAALASFRLVGIVAFPLAAVFLPFGEPLAVLLFGEAWRDSGPILVALVGMGLALPMESVSSEIFKASGRPEILPRMHVLWASTSIVLILLLVRVDGAVGVGIAWSISTVLTALYALVNVIRVVDLRPAELTAAIVRPLASALAAALAIVACNATAFDGRPTAGVAGAAWLLGELVAGAILYFVLLALVARQALAELRTTLGTLRRRAAQGTA
jgi:O-antigen/teichoic acid export membrane protein